MKLVKALVAFVVMVPVQVYMFVVTPFIAAMLCYRYNAWPWENITAKKKEMNKEQLEAFYDEILQEYKNGTHSH